MLAKEADSTKRNHLDRDATGKQVKNLQSQLTDKIIHDKRVVDQRMRWSEEESRLSTAVSRNSMW